MSTGKLKPLEDFVKQTIVDAFATSKQIRFDAAHKILVALVDKLDRSVSITITELGREQNSASIYVPPSYDRAIYEILGLEMRIYVSTDPPLPY